MSMSRALRMHAIYTVLGELDLLRASIAAIYDFVDGITIITNYDVDWNGNVVAPDNLVSEVLSRRFDPERKIDLLVSRETNEARSRNRAMDFALQRHKVLQQHRGDIRPSGIDYFWIIDADEIYSARDSVSLIEYVGRRRGRYYEVAVFPYFKSWNYRIDGVHRGLAFVRSDKRFGSLRNPYPTVVSRLAFKLRIPRTLVRRVFFGVRQIPEQYGGFHHGSYVGPRSRISDKVQGFGHADEVNGSWIETVFDTWTPETKDFHPVTPAAFPRAVEVPLDDLPREIADFDWPDGYLDR